MERSQGKATAVASRGGECSSGSSQGRAAAEIGRVNAASETSGGGKGSSGSGGGGGESRCGGERRNYVDVNTRGNATAAVRGEREGRRGIDVV